MVIPFVPVISAQPPPPPDPPVVRVRPACAGDLPAMHRVEVASFKVPWCAPLIDEVLHARGATGYVAETPRGVVGYMVYRRDALDLMLLRLAVVPSHRRRGVATRLMAVAVGKLRDLGLATATATVHERAVAAQCLLRGLGFRWIGTDRHYCAATGEAGYQLELRPRWIAADETPDARVARRPGGRR